MIILTIVGIIILVGLTCGVLATLGEILAPALRPALMIALAITALAILKHVSNGGAYVALGIGGALGAWDIYERITHTGDHKKRNRNLDLPKT